MTVFLVWSAAVAVGVLQCVLAIPIDNGLLGVPTVQCATDHIALLFNTQKPFNGRVFVKGYAYQTECSSPGNGQTADTFRITFNSCGVRRSRQITGIALSATVIISFHSLFLTKVDKAYRVNCFYMETSKYVTQNIDVSMMTTVALDGSVAMPVCRYEILAGNAQGPPVKFARIGDPVYHKWTCESDAPNTFCIRVHSCTVDDGAGGERIQVLDADGCSIDKYVLANLDYTSDMMAGQEAHVFKFADRPALFFNCEIEIRLKDSNFGCANVQPNCVSVSPVNNNGPYVGSLTPPAPNVPYSVLSEQQQQRQFNAQNQNSLLLQYNNNNNPVTTQQAGYRNNNGALQGLPDFISNPYAAYNRQSAAAAGAPQTKPNGNLYPSNVGRNGPYLSTIRRARRDVNAHHRNNVIDDAVNPLVAGFDLPQKRITVFDIDAGLEDPEADEGEMAEARRIVDLLTRPQLAPSGRYWSTALHLEDMVCLTNEKFVGYAVALAGVSVTSVTILAVVFIRRKSIFGVAWWDQKA